jgi:conjugal transfer/type IV secretion protein DotA/TraY
MSLMKNYLKIILTATLIIFSLNINASESVNASECNQKIKNIFKEINSDFDSKEQDAAIREDLTTKVFDKILGKDDVSLNQKKVNLAANLGPCLASPLEKDVAIKILRIMYGEVLNTPIKIISSLWGGFWGIEINVDESNLNKSTDIANLIPEIIKSFNNIIFVIALFIFAVVYSKEILGLIDTKNNRNLNFLGKNTIRILTGFSMIAPLPLFEGYSMIQFIFIIMLILAVLIAKVLWLFILLSINFSYYEKDIEQVMEDQDVKESYTDSISSNIMMHYCDIVKREKYLEEDLYKFNNKKTLLNDNEYYQCLQNEVITPNENIFVPDNIKIGNQCAVKYKDLTAEDYYCGFIENFSKLDPSESQVPKEIYEDLHIESNEFQGMLRSSAYEFRSYICKINGNNVVNGSNNKFKCPIKQGISDYAYNTDTGELLFDNTSFKTVDEKRDYIDDIKLRANNNITNYIDSKINQIVTGFISKTDDPKEEAEKLKNFLSLYEKGFAMAGSVFYEKIDYITPSYQSVEEFKKAYIVDTTINYATVADRRKIENFETGMDSSQIFDLDYETIKTITSEIYNGNIGSEEDVDKRSIMIGIGELVQSKTSCVVDFKTCHVNSINPFLDLMHYGNEMIVIGTYAKIAVSLVDKLYGKLTKNILKEQSYAANRSNEIFDFLGSIFSIYLLVGFFFAVLLPFIPFFTFAALFFGWILQSFKVIMGTQLLSLYFIIPEEKEDFSGKEKKIYKLLIKTALTPLFLITGFIVTLIIANISISLINVWLSIMIDSLGLHPNMGTILGILNGLIGVMIYAVLVTLAVIKANEAISGIPMAISQWLDIQLEEEKAFNQLKSLVENYIIPNMKGKLFF